MTLLYRCYHFLLKTLIRFIDIPTPRLFSGEGALDGWVELLKKRKLTRLLLVTDATVTSLGLAEPVKERLKREGISCFVYDKVRPNPSIDNVEQALIIYRENECRGIVALGGGSVMDCAKLVGARVARPNKPVTKMKGLFKILRKTPPLTAIPTTAGTGSETTIAAVVSDPDKGVKYAAVDFFLVPDHALLLPELTRSLPPFWSAATGLDALTHAIEAYIGINGLAFSDKRALEAIKLIFEHLPRVYRQGDDMEAREQMLLASFYAGQAFTRASVGYVHAIAHQFGARYDTPHGLANAMLLMPVLDWYGESIEAKLATVSDYCKLTDLGARPAQKAEAVRNKIRSLVGELAIPSELKELQEADISALARAAMDEAHPEYPVPRFMAQAECEALIRSLCPAQHAQE